MTVGSDLFAQINNAVLDLQSAQLQTFERPLKNLSRLLQHEDLAEINSELTKGLDLEAFLEENEDSGGLIGSATIDWPEEPKMVLGYTLLLIMKFADEPNFMMNFGHHYYNSGSKVINAIRSITGQMIIPFVRDYRAFVENKDSVRPRLTAKMSNRIFIVHGHDNYARETVARFLEKIGFDAIILHEQANKGRTIIEKVEAESDVGFAVVLLTPDDVGSVQGGTPEPRARQNVILELGYFIGRLGRERVCALKRGTLDIPSDFTGVVWTEMDDSNGWRTLLARELMAAGYDIDWNKVMK